MNIIFGVENIPELDEKYVVLELDTFKLPGKSEPMTAYCVVENVPIMTMAQVDSMKNLHHNLMLNYRKKDWKYCGDALEHLMGFWGGEMDTFYEEIQKRISSYKQQDPGETWNGIIDKT